MIDPALISRARAVAVDDSVARAVDVVIVLGSAGSSSELRGGTLSDVDLRRAEFTDRSRERSAWRPHFMNRGIVDQVKGNPSPARPAEPAEPSPAVRFPSPDDGSTAVEVSLFWAIHQLLSEWSAPDEAAKVATLREVRAACGAAFYARAKGIDEQLIEESLADIALLCDSLIWRRQAVTAGSPAARSRHAEAVRAVDLLATGLPSSARLRLEEMM